MRTIAVLLLLAGVALQAQPVIPNVAPKTNVTMHLVWNPNSELSVSHYNIRRGISSGTYTEMMRVDGRLNTNSYWTNLTFGITNYFVATAVDTNGIESEYSNEASGVALRPSSPQLQTAIPITAFIESKTGDGQWVLRHKVGPLYVVADAATEVFRVRLQELKPVAMMPNREAP